MAAAGGRSVWRRAAALALGAAVALTLGLSLWAGLSAPPRTEVDRRQVGAGTLIALPEDRASSRWWRCELELDHHLRPGPRWILHAGGAEGPGHSLRWDPGSLSLHLLRRQPPGSGPLPTPDLLIATIPLAHAPDRLVWSRRDHRHALATGDQPLGQWEDALPAPGVRGWELVPTGDLGVTSLAVYDDRHLQRQADSVEEEILDPEAARELVRRALALPADSAEGVALREDARAALSIIGSESPVGSELAPWLAWDAARGSLGENPALPTLPLADAVDRLAATGGDPASGLGLLLVPPLAWRATRAPVAPLPARTWIERRREWLRTTARTGDLRTGIVDLDWELALLGHLSRVLAGATPEPTPTDAPAWVTTRWRLAAGVPLPLREGAPAPVPDLPAPGRPSIRPATAALLAHGGLSDAAAAQLRCEVLAALGRAQPTAALDALQRAPPREAVLVRALLACNGIGDAQQARAALAGGGGSGGSWREIDPLAWALDRLLAHRLGLVPPPTMAVEPGQPSPLEAELPPGLHAFSKLLSGKPGATMLVFAYEDANLPPLHALAAALAMQEVAGEDPDWSLLAEAPCLDLPLHLMRPPPGEDSTP